MPFVLENDHIACFDVDETLVLWNIPPGFEGKTVECINYGYKEHLLPHDVHIKLLRQFKFRGHAVVIWSQGGYEWAVEVAKRLGIFDDANIIMAKPKWLIDDLPPDAWTQVFYKKLLQAEEDTKKAMEKMVKEMELDEN